MKPEQYRKTIKVKPTPDGHIATLPDEAAEFLGTEFIINISPFKETLMLIPEWKWSEFKNRIDQMQ